MVTNIRILSRMSPFLAALALFFLAGYAPRSLIFDRQAIFAGEFWRLFSCHFVHCDLEHLSLNLLGLMVLILIFDEVSPLKIWSLLALGIVVVDTWIWFEMKELEYYCGLSGIENTLLVVGLNSIWNSNKSKYAAIAGVLSLAKIIYEITTQNALFSKVSWQAVPEAHAAGFTAGLLLILFIKNHRFF